MTLPTGLPDDPIVTDGVPLPEEARALLRATGWGVLAVRDAETRRPYAVPVAYAFDGEAIVVATLADRPLGGVRSWRDARAGRGRHTPARVSPTTCVCPKRHRRSGTHIPR